MSERQTRESARQGRLLARLAQKIGNNVPPLTHGLHPLVLDETRDAFLYVPSHYHEDSPVPLIL